MHQHKVKIRDQNRHLEGVKTEDLHGIQYAFLKLEKHIYLNNDLFKRKMNMRF